MRRFFLLIILASLPWACASGTVEKAPPDLYSTLPESNQSKTIPEYESAIRVAEGKAAKLRTDQNEAEEEVHQADMDVQARKSEIKEIKLALHERRKVSTKDPDIERLNKELKMAQHRLKISEQVYYYKKQQKNAIVQEIDVLVLEQKVNQSKVELEKVKAIHEYTDYKVRKSKIDVASFEQQLRRNELDESRARYQLAKIEKKKAQAEYDVRVLQEADIFRTDSPGRPVDRDPSQPMRAEDGVSKSSPKQELSQPRTSSKKVEEEDL